MSAAAQPLTGNPDLIPEADAKTVLGWLSEGSIILIDVRETTEYEQEHIQGALLCPLSMFDADLFPRFADKTIVLHCAVGKRSAAAAKQLVQAEYGDVVNLQGGLQAWKEAGCPTQAHIASTNSVKQLPYVDLPKVVQPSPVDDTTPHPGHVLEREFLIPLGIKRAELAESTGISPAKISAIIQGDGEIQAVNAIRLARFLCTTDEFWMRLQTTYDLAQARHAHKDAIHKQVKPHNTITSQTSDG